MSVPLLPLLSTLYIFARFGFEMLRANGKGPQWYDYVILVGGKLFQAILFFGKA